MRFNLFLKLTTKFKLNLRMPKMLLSFLFVFAFVGPYVQGYRSMTPQLDIVNVAGEFKFYFLEKCADL